MFPEDEGSLMMRFPVEILIFSIWKNNITPVHMIYIYFAKNMYVSLF